MELDGRRVLITGGSSGIGFATAQAILARGARVLVTGRRPDVLGVKAKLAEAARDHCAL